VDRIGRVITVVRAVGRPAVGLIGLAVLVGAVAPLPGPEGRTRLDRGARSPLGDTITLEVPGGEVGRTLTVVDESGRELARLTRWKDGGFAVSARRDGAPGVYCWLPDGPGTAKVNLFGTSRGSRLAVQPDGTVKSFDSDVSERHRPSEDSTR